MSDDEERVGFEVGGEFVPLEFNADQGKDLMLLDRITGWTVAVFMDEWVSGTLRGPVFLTLLATSLRAKHPDWSVDRIYRVVSGDLGGVDFVGLEADGDPPAEAAPEAATSPDATSPSDGSSPSSTLPAPSTGPQTSEPSYAAPV